MTSRLAVLLIIFSTVAASQRVPAVFDPQDASGIHEQFGVYWTNTPGWDTDIQIRNNYLAGPIKVTPSLRLSGGGEITLPEVTVRSSEVQTLDVGALLAKVAPGVAGTVGAWGSLVVRYTSNHLRNIYVAMIVRSTAHPIMFHLDAFPRPLNFQSGSREGIWWIENQQDAHALILTNLSDHKVQSEVSLSNASGQERVLPVEIAAFQSLKFELSELLHSAGLSGTYGGIRIRQDRDIGSLESTVLVFNETTGFAAQLKMFDNDPRMALENRKWGGLTKWVLRAPMLALAHPDPTLGFPEGTYLYPKIFLRKTSSEDITAKLFLRWQSSSQSGITAELPISVGARETELIDIEKLQQDGILPSAAHWAMATVETESPPNSLIAIAASFDQTGHHGAQTPFSDQLGSHWVGSEWQAGPTKNTIIAIGNGGTSLTTAAITLFFDSGKKKYEVERTLGAGEQIWFDLNLIINSGIPDKNGLTIPRGVTSGTYDLWDRQYHLMGNLFEGKVIIDKTFGHATYGCMVCCGPGITGISLDPTDVGTGFSQDASVQGVDDCSGEPEDDTGYFTSCWTGNSSIATASVGSIHGANTGTTHAYAHGTIPVGGGIDSRDCPTTQRTVNNNVNVVAIPTNFHQTGVTSTKGI
jgi:hypothetical protein